MFNKKGVYATQGAKMWHNGEKMQEKPIEDLRVRRTKECIRKTFTTMICEMDYEKITIKELASRAGKSPQGTGFPE
ncbi:hypothetical protein FACS1894163_10370 [Spirochaetia bacterium]|nr:hypothetical protein FACS1894163_10370 [Spirochaetia bacterium]